MLCFCCVTGYHWLMCCGCRPRERRWIYRQSIRLLVFCGESRLLVRWKIAFELNTYLIAKYSSGSKSSVTSSCTTNSPVTFCPGLSNKDLRYLAFHAEGGQNNQLCDTWLGPAPSAGDAAFCCSARDGDISKQGHGAHPSSSA